MNREVPRRLGCTSRGGLDEVLWAWRAKLAPGAPETAYCAEHELVAGLFVKQGEAVGKQVL